MSVLLSIAALTLATPPQEEPDRVAAMTAYLGGCEAFGFRGAVLVADGDDVLVRAGFGHDGERELTADAVFELGELAQWFTSVAALQLAEREEWRLLDPLRDYLGGVHNVHRDVTLRQLLSHTSGMSRFGVFVEEVELGSAVRRHLSVRPVAKAGERVQPWDGGYTLLAAAIQAVAGESFESRVERDVFRAAGMETAAFHGSLEDLGAPRARARGDRRAAGSQPLHWGTRGARGVAASVDDLFRFDRALASGRLLSPAMTERMERAVRSGFALGVWSRTVLSGRAAVWRAGREPGFESELWRFPDEDAAVIVLAAEDGGRAGAIARYLGAMLFGEEPPLPLPPETVEVAEVTAASLAGVYTAETGAVFALESDGGALRATGLDDAGHDLLFTGSLDTSLDRFDGEKEKALAILAELASEGGAGDGALAVEAVEDGLRRRSRASYASAVARRGSSAPPRVVRATSVGAGRVRVIVAHEGEDGGEWLAALTFAGGVWVDLDLEARRDELDRRFLPTAADTWVTFGVYRTRAPVLRFGASAELTVETPSGRTARARRAE